MISTPQGVIHQESGKKLRLLVKRGILVKRLTTTLRNTAIQLTTQCDRVEDDTKIINHDEELDLGKTGVWINLYLNNIAAVRVSRTIGLKSVLNVKRMRSRCQSQLDHKLI